MSDRVTGPGTGHDEAASEYRDWMVERQIRRRGIEDPNILLAFSRVPRELFTPPSTPLATSYGDHPLSIGFGQTVSQPYIVAYMIDLLQLSGRRDARLLEIGTGSGYQTALLAEMGFEIVSLEVVPELIVRARHVLDQLGLLNRVALIAADGYNGWDVASPYDGIIVSAAPGSLPEALPGQLAVGGRLVIPVGSWHQEIIVIKRKADGGFETRRGVGVRFVPLINRASGRSGSSDTE